VTSSSTTTITTTTTAAAATTTTALPPPPSPGVLSFVVVNTVEDMGTALQLAVFFRIAL
jgi:hypothetical protein